MTAFKQRISATAVALALAAVAPTALAGGFGIGTQSGSGTGNAFAGGAAVADDASVAWSNPAAMTLLPAGSQVTVAGHVIFPSFKFNNTGSTVPGTLGSGNGGDGGEPAFVPNFFYTTTITPNLRFGFAVNVPFGLATEYDAGWIGQTVSLESSIKTINLNPSLGYRLTDTFSVGGGISVQKIDAKLSRFTGAAASGHSTLAADDVSVGFNLGAMLLVTPSTRLGMSYRSSISYDLEGTAMFNGTSAAALNGNVRAAIKVPHSASLSVFSVVDPKWEVMADITHTGWSSIVQLDIFRTSGAFLSSEVFNWGNSMRYGVGANYRMNQQTKLRFGLAYDETPTNNVNRSPRLPDQDRTWVALGVQFQPGKSGVWEVGYAHEFVKDATVNNAAAAGRLIGTFSNKADILSVQYSHRF